MVKKLLLLVAFIMFISPLVFAHSGNTELEEKDHEEIKVSDYGLLGKGYKGWLTLLTLLIIIVFLTAWLVNKPKNGKRN